MPNPKSSHDGRSPTAPEALLKALNRLLHPLVRLLIHFGINYPYLSQLLKSIYVEAAEKSISQSGQKPPTDSHISLVTGVHRKDVRRLRHQSHEQSQPDKSTSLGAELIAYWLADKAYTNAQGEPSALPRTEKDVADPNASNVSFESLVKTISKGDLRPKVMLEELQRLGCVSLNDKRQVVLNRQAFIPSLGLDEKSFYLGKVIHDHLAASTANLIACDQQQEALFFDRCVYYDKLTAESAINLQKNLEASAMELLKNVNRQARQMQQADSKADNANHRFNLGVYFFHCDESEDLPHVTQVSSDED